MIGMHSYAEGYLECFVAFAELVQVQMVVLRLQGAQEP